MESNSNFLRHFITEELYIVSEKPSTPDTQVAEAKTEYVTPKSGTMIVLGKPEEKESETLIKLLAAIKLNDPQFSTTLDLNSGHANYLLFGVDSDLEKYMITQVGGVQVLNSHSIEELNKDEILKRQLWGQLKKMFS